MRIMTQIACLALMLTLSSSIGASKWECGERSNLPIEGKNYCAAGDFRQSETNLTKLLAVLLKKHQELYGDAALLSEAQSAFKSYRDSQCKAENQRIEEQPYHPMLVAQCKTRLTNLRIKELMRMKD